jgi:hypothetical protein
LVAHNATNKSQLLEIQAKILRFLHESNGDNLDDIEFIDTLTGTKNLQNHKLLELFLKVSLNHFSLFFQKMSEIKF